MNVCDKKSGFNKLWTDQKKKYRKIIKGSQKVRLKWKAVNGRLERQAPERLRREIVKKRLMPWLWAAARVGVCEQD